MAVMEARLSDPVLVLNSAMIAIDICTVKEAVLDIFREIAIPIREGNGVLRSPSCTIKVPRVIAHTSYHKIPRSEIRFSKLKVIYRDDQACVYCRRRFAINELTVDHVVPRSRWKRLMGEYPAYDFNSWENMVAACKRCNTMKGNRLLHELGWKLDKKPAAPNYMPSLFISRRRAEKMGWMDYCGYNVALLEPV